MNCRTKKINRIEVGKYHSKKKTITLNKLQAKKWARIYQLYWRYLRGGVGKGGGGAMELTQGLLFIFPSLLNYHILAGQPISVLLARKSFPRKYVISFHSFSRELQIDNRKWSFCFVTEQRLKQISAGQVIVCYTAIFSVVAWRH